MEKEGKETHKCHVFTNRQVWIWPDARIFTGLVPSRTWFYADRWQPRAGGNALGKPALARFPALCTHGKIMGSQM